MEKTQLVLSWREHYQNTLNHSSVTPSADLDDFADSATPDVMVSEDVPMLHEVTRAIRRLKNGRAAGADGITAELLKGTSRSLCGRTGPEVVL